MESTVTSPSFWDQWLPTIIQFAVVALAATTLWFRLSSTIVARGELTTALQGFQAALTAFQNDVNLMNGNINNLNSYLRTLNDNIHAIEKSHAAIENVVDRNAKDIQRILHDE